ncbi:MAG: tetratricopeptide repeat protein [Spirochaetales bacterium]|nr:tetratricopeptide repeat protein [Spirochaetales bacterium]
MIRPDKKRLAKDIGYLSALSKAGYKSLQQGNITAAEHYFKQLLEVDPNNKYALTGMGEIETSKDNSAQAIEYYMTCTLHHKKDIQSHEKLAETFWKIKDFKNAALFWEKLLTFDPNNNLILSHLGDVYRKLDRMNDAEKMYYQSLQKNPENKYALNGIASLYYENLRYTEAITFIIRLLKLESDNIKAITFIGNCYRKLQSFSEALVYYNRAYNLESDNFYVLFGLADCNRGLKIHDLALEFWLKILEIDPDNHAILSRAGDALFAVGDISGAEEYYQQAITIGNDIHASIGIAKIEQLNGNWQKSLQILNELSQDNPLNIRILFENIHLLIRLELINKAEKKIDNYLNSGGSDLEIDHIKNMLKNVDA